MIFKANAPFIFLKRQKNREKRRLFLFAFAVFWTISREKKIIFYKKTQFEYSQLEIIFQRIMMKKLFFACALMGCSLAMPTMSASQDYCCSPQYDPCCCGTGFDGIYIGGNVGASSHTFHRNDLDGFFTDNAGSSNIHTNVTAGVLLGYDWQLCNKVLGIVADWNWVNVRGRHRDNPSVEAGNFLNNKARWFTTIRARAGLTISDTLVYVTGGAAVTKLETRWNNDPVTFNNNNTRWGWTGGVGAEFLISCNWSLGAEFLFLQFANDTRKFTSGVTTFEFGHSDSAMIGRIVLNYRFGDLFCCN